MDAMRTTGRRLTLLAWALAAPAIALAQERLPLRSPPPGGTAWAWPLGIIVALVAAVWVLGWIVSRRRERHGVGRV